MEGSKWVNMIDTETYSSKDSYKTEAQIYEAEATCPEATAAKIETAKAMGQGVPPPGATLGWYYDPSRRGIPVYLYESNLEHESKMTREEGRCTRNTTGVLDVTPLQAPLPPPAAEPAAAGPLAIGGDAPQGLAQMRAVGPIVGGEVWRQATSRLVLNLRTGLIETSSAASAEDGGGDGLCLDLAPVTEETSRCFVGVKQPTGGAVVDKEDPRDCEEGGLSKTKSSSTSCTPPPLSSAMTSSRAPPLTSSAMVSPSRTSMSQSISAGLSSPTLPPPASSTSRPSPQKSSVAVGLKKTLVQAETAATIAAGLLNDPTAPDQQAGEMSAHSDLGTGVELCAGAGDLRGLRAVPRDGTLWSSPRRVDPSDSPPCQGASASSLGHGELSAPEVPGTANGTATDLGSSRSGQFQRERGGEPPGSATSTGDHKQEEPCHSGAKLSSCGDPCTCTGVNSSSGGDQHHELRGSGPGGARASVAGY